MIPEDVRLVMNGWLENQSQLALVGNLFGLAVALRCRVGFIDAAKVELETSDGGRIAVDLSGPGLDFKYAEPREFPEMDVSSEITAGQQFSSMIAVLFPRRLLADLPNDVEDVSEAESLMLMELID